MPERLNQRLSFGTFSLTHAKKRYWGPGQNPGNTTPSYRANGQIIGEGVIDTQNASNSTDFSVRYFYSGNQKVAMERRDMSTGQTSLYYFINNAQGTPVLILDSSGQTKSRINLDEWGNLGMLQGPSQEINFTGKKLDVSTGLYYFNQRYYDPEIGRFLQEDPAGQGLNPYRYCGNNPLMYTDPDGQFAFLIPYIVAAIQGASIAAAVNTTVQWAANGYDSKKINWHSVGQSAISGAIGGAFNYGIGEAFQHGTTDLGQFATKTAAHGLSGSVQNAILGGNVGTGFLSGSAGYAAGCMGASLGGDLGGLAGSSLGGGAASAASGGDFGSGAQIGAMGYLFNSVGEWTVNMGVSSLSSVLRSAFQTDFGMRPGQVTDKAGTYAKNKAIGVANLGIDAINIVGPINIAYGLFLLAPVNPTFQEYGELLYNHINYDPIHGMVPTIPYIKNIR